MNACFEIARKAGCWWVSALAGIFFLVGQPQAFAGTNSIETELRLSSDYLPNSFQIKGDQLKREIHSIDLIGKVPQAGDGAAQIRLDPRPAELNDFGDIGRRRGPTPALVSVKLERISDPAGERAKEPGAPSSAPESKGSRVYKVVFPGNEMTGRLKLVLAAATGPHRLLVYGEPVRPRPASQEGVMEQIVALHGSPATTSLLPDLPLQGDIDLSGFYGGQDGRMHRVEVIGILGGKGRVGFDPNQFGFDAFGNCNLTTCMGFFYQEITLKPVAGLVDPLDKGRRRYLALPKDPRNTNQVVLILGATEASPHRILVYRGNQAELIVPALLGYRRIQEGKVSELVGLPPGEQAAIADLRRTIGHGFGWEIEDGQVIALNVYSSTRSFPPDGVLARLPKLRRVNFGGGLFPPAGVPDLNWLTELRRLSFTGAQFDAASLATLENLTQLEDLSFRDCRGVTDEAVKHLAGLTGLKGLGVSFEVSRQPSDKGPGVTDAGVMQLENLSELEQLNLFGQDVSDLCVASLLKMKGLKGISLTGHGFTDAGLERLVSLPKLRYLRLFETSVTPDAVAKVGAQFPELKIEAWGLDSHD